MFDEKLTFVDRTVYHRIILTESAHLISKKKSILLWGKHLISFEHFLTPVS
jgi:hypothetical protein